MEDTCTTRAALSRGIPTAQQVLLSSPQPSELGDGALGRWREAHTALPGSPEGFRHPFPEDRWMRHKTQKQSSTGSAKRAPVVSHCSCMQHLSSPQALIKGLSRLLLIQEGAQAGLGCLTPRHCPKFWNAWQHFPQ